MEENIKKGETVNLSLPEHGEPKEENTISVIDDCPKGDVLSSMAQSSKDGSLKHNLDDTEAEESIRNISSTEVGKVDISLKRSFDDIETDESVESNKRAKVDDETNAEDKKEKEVDKKIDNSAVLIKIGDAGNHPETKAGKNPIVEKIEIKIKEEHDVNRVKPKRRGMKVEKHDGEEAMETEVKMALSSETKSKIPSSEESKDDKSHGEKRRYPTRGSIRTEEKDDEKRKSLTECPEKEKSSMKFDEKRKSLIEYPEKEKISSKLSSDTVSKETDTKESSQQNQEVQSEKSDSGSDKENLSSELPVDLSNSGTPDVITLSDEEEVGDLQLDDEKKRALRRIKRLQADLRNEEAKLVLLKKLRQSQMTPQLQEHPPLPNGNAGPALNQIKQGVQRQPGVPPPLVRGTHQQNKAPSSGMHLQQQHQHQQSRTLMQNQSRTVQGPPPLIGGLRSGINNVHGMQNLRGNMVPGIIQHNTNAHRNLQQQQSTPQPQHQQPAALPQPAVDMQTPAQRQAAAKLALRKQLEKTLLQIPPPKPPAPEMNFIPSLACPDFILLLGLEEVVNHIVDLQLIARGQKSPDEKFICNPFTCVQCNTDYTPVWKREKPGSKNVICEHCVTWNQKRALKQEHTNRLKSAFVKALQQEQEIERMQAQTLTSTPPAPSPAVTPPAPIITPSPQALAAAANSVAAATAMSMNSASFRANAEHLRQQHSFLQQQAQLRAGQPLGIQAYGARAPFPYSLPPYAKQADLQRQYLLDMIPRPGMWKQ